jgi:glycosyltransferase involved in cell wall biosynthesis
MRTLLVTNMYPNAAAPYYGIFVRDHVQSVAALGVDLEVFFVNGKQSRSEYVRAVPRLARQLRAGAFELAHVQHSYCVLQVVLARRLAGRRLPILFTMHEGEAFLPSGAREPGAHPLKQLVYSKWIKRRAATFADRVVAVAPGLADAIGFSGPVDVIPPGIDTERFRPLDREHSRKQLGLPQDVPIVFFPASPSRGFGKGHALFQEAVASLRTPVHVVTGGSIPPEDMPLYMNAADVVVQTSLFEASPMVVKEALACDRPVVSTDVGDVRTVLQGLAGSFMCSREADDVAAKIESALSVGRRAGEGPARIDELGLSLRAVSARYADLYDQVAHAANGER